MKRIAYAEEWLTTDDEVADLVLEYARALALHDSSDTVAIPVLDGDAVRRAQFLIGPASQIIVVETDEPRPAHFRVEIELADLRDRLERLERPRPVAYDSDESAEMLPDY